MTANPWWMAANATGYAVGCGDVELGQFKEREHALRAKAAVNAVAGIPTEALEAVGADGLRQIIELAYDKIARKALTCKNAAWRTSDQQLFDALEKLRTPT